ncbi:motility associated factor glycosyltransferase family protein [Paenibacillus chungangensis]|uniref:Motility associated factor glycosyltransferase family protein n=1 Tax=Paenibacillus chungangensis TaxID=696535 RepID=A0ABW3HWH2_9BACL
MSNVLKEINSVLDEVRDYLPNLIDSCSYMADVLMDSKIDNAWNEFGQLIEGMNNLYKTLNFLNSRMSEQLGLVNQTLIYNSMQQFETLFYSLNQYMDNEDYWGASDHIRYELNALLHTLAAELGEKESIKSQRFKANKEYFRQKHPMLYTQIEDTMRNQENYQVIYTRNSMPNLYISTNNDHPIYYYSKFDPMYEAKKWVESLSVKGDEKSHVFVYGFGFGYHVQCYSQTYSGHSLYIYEPDIQIFLAALEVISFEDLFHQLNIAEFVVGDQKEPRDRMFYRYLRYKVDEPEFIAIPVYNKINTTNKEQFIQDASNAILNYKSSLLMNETAGIQWVKNSMYNMARVLSTPSILGLKGEFKGVPAVIVGAGPSLEAEIDWIKKLKKHALIIAAGSTIQSLLHYGLKPHLIVSIDGGEENNVMFNGVEINNIPLLYAPMINYQVIDHQKNNMIHMFLNNDLTSTYFLKLNDNDPVFQSNLSVTGIAIQAAIYMGCRDIVLAGQDLSYPTDQMYASGAKQFSKEKMNEVIRNADLEIENVKGTMNRTNQMMKLTLSDIEDLLHKHPNYPFINCSSKGAKIKGAPFKPIQEVFASLIETQVNDDALLSRMAHLTDYSKAQKTIVAQQIENLVPEIDDIEKRLTHIDHLINEALKSKKMKEKNLRSLFHSIHSEWKIVLDSHSFKGLYLKICRNELYDFERDFTQFSTEKDVRRRVELLQNVMKPLLKAMLLKTPIIKEIIIETNNRIKNLDINADKGDNKNDVAK